MTIKAVEKICYVCSVCKAEYKSRRDAERSCGALDIEDPTYTVGETVLVYHAGHERKVIISEIVGPVRGNQCKNGRRVPFTAAHVYMYRVKVADGNPEIPYDFWSSELKKCKQ